MYSVGRMLQLEVKSSLFEHEFGNLRTKSFPDHWQILRCANSDHGCEAGRLCGVALEIHP